MNDITLHQNGNILQKLKNDGFNKIINKNIYELIYEFLLSKNKGNLFEIITDSKKENKNKHLRYFLEKLNMINSYDIIRSKLNLTSNQYLKILIKFFESNDILTVYRLFELTYNAEMDMIIAEYLGGSKETDAYDSRRNYNSSTYNQTLYALSSFFKYLKKYGVRNPTSDISPLESLKESNTVSIGGEDNLKRILNHMQNKYFESKTDKDRYVNLRNYLIFCFLAMSLRRNEVANLLWKNKKHNGDKVYFEVLQKGGSTKKTPIKPNLLRNLDIYEELQYNILGFEADYVFTPFSNNTKSTLNKPITPDYIYELVKKNIGEIFNKEMIEEIDQHIEKIRLEKIKLHKKIQRAVKSKNINTVELNAEMEKLNAQLNKLYQEKKEIKKKTDISPHSFRKNLIEICLKLGLTNVEISNTTGHSPKSADQMIRYYQGLDTAEFNAINKLDFI